MGFIELLQRNPHTGADQTSYTATLVVADEPPRQVFNARRAWSKKLARLAVPAEISWRYSLIPPKQWKRLADRAVVNVEDESKDRAKAGAEPDDSFEARRDQAAQIKADNADDDLQPGMVGRLRLTVSAPTPAALARAIKDVKAAMGDVTMEVPAHAALPLLLEQFPGETVGTDLGSLSAGPAGGLGLWSRYSDLYQPALGMLGSHNQVGDRIQVERGRALGWIGIPIGYVKSNGTVVHFDPHAQIGRGHGAGIAVLGQSGGGKSSFVILMFFWLSESGVRCSVLDPKIDFAGFAYYIAFGPQVLDPAFMADADAGILGTPASRFQPVNREFWDDTEIVDLARGARGSQDPWRINDTFDDGYSLALDLTDVLFTDQAHRSIVRKALRSMSAAHKEATAAGRSFTCGYGDALSYIRSERQELEADYQSARKSGDTSTLRNARDEFDEVITRLENGERVPFLRLLLGKGSRPATDGPSGAQTPSDLHDGRVHLPRPSGEPRAVDRQGPQRLRGDAVGVVPDAAGQPERPDEYQPRDRRTRDPAQRIVCRRGQHGDRRSGRTRIPDRQLAAGPVTELGRVLHRPAGPRHAGNRKAGQRGVRRGQPVRNGARVQATIQRGGPGGVGRVAQQR